VPSGSTPLEQRVVDLDRRETPAIRAQTRGARFELRLKVAVVLLQMLRLQEHAFRPDDLAVPVHDSFASLCVALARRRAWGCACSGGVRTARQRSGSFSAPLNASSCA
jgi:hypothetical protein